MSIDIISLRQEIDNIAKRNLKVISASSLKLFTLEVENTTKKYVKSYVEEKYNFYSSKLIGDKLSKFLNLSNGYLVTMNNWINQTEFNFPVIPVLQEQDEKGLTTSSLQEFVKRKEVQTFGIGTAVSIFLFISGIRIVAFVTEAIAAAASLFIYKQEAKICNENMKRDFEIKVNDFIFHVINSAINWTKMAENKSKSMLISYK